MALKLNIKAEIEEEMDALLPKVDIRSKTEYINRAIQEYNRKLKRQMELAKLKNYFRSYQKEGRAILRDFQKIRNS